MRFRYCGKKVNYLRHRRLFGKMFSLIYEAKLIFCLQNNKKKISNVKCSDSFGDLSGNAKLKINFTSPYLSKGYDNADNTL